MKNVTKALLLSLSLVTMGTIIAMDEPEGWKANQEKKIVLGEFTNKTGSPLEIYEITGGDMQQGVYQETGEKHLATIPAGDEPYRLNKAITLDKYKSFAIKDPKNSTYSLSIGLEAYNQNDMMPFHAQLLRFDKSNKWGTETLDNTGSPKAPTGYNMGLDAVINGENLEKSTIRFAPIQK